MAAISKVLRSMEGDGLAFRCPGCKRPHLIHVGAGSGPRWGWNGNAEKPTFTPSVLVKTGSRVDPSCVWEEGDPPEVCHSFVTDGQIQFLGDCTHELANQTVDLPDFEVSRDV